jgi:hypothetical protein
MSKKNALLLMAFALELVLCFPAPAGAYTDPNVGNLIYQILFPVITALSMGYLFCKKYIKRKFTSWKNRLGKKTTKDEPSALDPSKE